VDRRFPSALAFSFAPTTRYPSSVIRRLIRDLSCRGADQAEWNTGVWFDVTV
jgi:hypothetical protein